MFDNFNDNDFNTIIAIIIIMFESSNSSPLFPITQSNGWMVTTSFIFVCVCGYFFGKKTKNLYVNGYGHAKKKFVFCQNFNVFSTSVQYHKWHIRFLFFVVVVNNTDRLESAVVALCRVSGK